MSVEDHKNLRYGRAMESLAKERYREATGNEVLPAGLCVKPCQPWLCATPDAIVRDENGNLLTLELKCPISCKGKDISVPYLTDQGLKVSHEYYCQVQLQLYCCNLHKSHFFVFSEKDAQLVEIDRNDEFL